MITQEKERSKKSDYGQNEDICLWKGRHISSILRQRLRKWPRGGRYFRKKDT